jgi:transcription initiation factor TFIIIB Brf1 subunit/transcription initiation factor TFIIB
MADRLQKREGRMHCPECHSLNETGATACLSCGLLLIHVPSASGPEPHRRAEDQAVQRRRARDHEVLPCQFCGGEIDAKAIRCRHCSEIVNEDYYRERANRLRARVNYASWVAYLFGLAALLVFRPVGIVSIAGGMLLSIIYYAIPVDPPMTSSSAKRLTLGERLRRQLKVERVAIPIPRFKNKKLILVGTPLFAAVAGYGANHFLLQEPMNDVLKENASLQGMNVSAHYRYWVIPGVVQYDLQSLTVRQTPIDVHTALLEFARKVRARRFSRVEISYQGVAKFSVDGANFQRLGDEYARHNYDYALYGFPKGVQRIGPPQPPTAGLDGREALLQFHRQWYGRDILTKPVHDGL